MIAALPMYDLPGIKTQTDSLWNAISERLRHSGVDAPTELTRGLALLSLWTDPQLLLSQTCGYPLMTQLMDSVKVVATPIYRAQGCEGPAHRSFIIVRKNDGRETLAAFRGSRCAMNEETSNTGMNLFRATIAPLINPGEPFFSAVVTTGSHAASIDAVSRDIADIAAVDCVTYALLKQINGLAMADVRVLDQTTLSPALPWIASKSLGCDTFALLGRTLKDVAADPDLRPTLDALLIDGFDDGACANYGAVLRAERSAISLGYPKLQ